MQIGAAVWVTIPAIGALIGYVTNRIAVKMIFRPIKPTKVLGYTLQGLIGRRQKDLAASIGRVVGDHLVEKQDVVRALENMDLEGLIGGALDSGLGPKIAEMRRMPLVGSFLTDERVNDLKQAVIQGILKDKATIAAQLEKTVESSLDIEGLVRAKVESFEVERLESLVLEVASKELRHIEILGALLGGIIGVLQVALIALL